MAFALQLLLCRRPGRPAIQEPPPGFAPAENQSRVDAEILLVPSVFPRATRTVTAALLLAIFATGCEEKNYDHVPPAGRGSLVLDNYTADRIRVFLDGGDAGELSRYGDAAWDLPPGLHRVVLDQREGPRHTAWDVDIITGRLTVIRIRVSDWNWCEYDGEFSVRAP